jgi:hypothetical protein
MPAVCSVGQRLCRSPAPGRRRGARRAGQGCAGEGGAALGVEERAQAGRRRPGGRRRLWAHGNRREAHRGLGAGQGWLTGGWRRRSGAGQGGWCSSCCWRRPGAGATRLGVEEKAHGAEGCDGGATPEKGGAALQGCARRSQVGFTGAQGLGYRGKMTCTRSRLARGLDS